MKFVIITLFALNAFAFATSPESRNAKLKLTNRALMKALKEIQVAASNIGGPVCERGIDIGRDASITSYSINGECTNEVTVMAGTLRAKQLTHLNIHLEYFSPDVNGGEFCDTCTLEQIYIGIQGKDLDCFYEGIPKGHATHDYQFPIQKFAPGTYTIVARTLNEHYTNACRPLTEGTPIAVVNVVDPNINVHDRFPYSCSQDHRDRDCMPYDLCVDGMCVKPEKNLHFQFLEDVKAEFDETERDPWSCVTMRANNIRDGNLLINKAHHEECKMYNFCIDAVCVNPEKNAANRHGVEDPSMVCTVKDDGCKGCKSVAWDGVNYGKFKEVCKDDNGVCKRKGHLCSAYNPDDENSFDGRDILPYKCSKDEHCAPYNFCLHNFCMKAVKNRYSQSGTDDIDTSEHFDYEF